MLPSRNRRRFQVGALLFIVCAVACNLTKADVTREITVEQVLEAWEKRQKQVQSLRMEWNESFTQTGAALLIKVGLRSRSGTWATAALP